MKARESRKPLKIPAQIRCDGAIANVTIRNVSSHGMMMSGAVLPPPGTHVDVVRGNLALAGRVVWSAADLCGVRTDAKIDDVLLIRGCYTAPQTGGLRSSDSGASYSGSLSSPLRERSSSTLLRELQRLHAGLIDAISALEDLLCSEISDRRSVADIRLRLMRASGEKLKLIETAIYPHLEQRVPALDRAVLEQLRNESFLLRANSARHVAAWSLDRIVENWAGYSRASTEMRAAMCRRVEREKAVLYPLLQNESGRSARDTPFSFEPYKEAC